MDEFYSRTKAFIVARGFSNSLRVDWPPNSSIWSTITPRLSSSWTTLLAGLQALGRQIHTEHVLQTRGRGRLQIQLKTVESRVMSWIGEHQNQDEFVHAKRDVLRSWATPLWDIVALLGGVDPRDKLEFSQEELDSILGMPWSKQGNAEAEPQDC